MAKEREKEGKITLASFVRIYAYLVPKEGKSHGLSIIYTLFKPCRVGSSQQVKINIDQTWFGEKKKNGKELALLS